jgi:prepilin signal peptidase PulO-like enzyme (type II secretory pathway)
MTRLSSQWTFFYKRLFPVIWFGFILLFVLLPWATRHQPQGLPLPLFIMPVVMGVFGYLLFRRLLFDLVDEIWDDGEALVARNGGIEQRIPLQNIINVGFSTMTRPERVTLRLRDAGPLGQDVTFMPPTRFTFATRNPIIDQLIERIDRARRAH